MPVIPAFGSLRQKEHSIKISLGYHRLIKTKVRDYIHNLENII